MEFDQLQAIMIYDSANMWTRLKAIHDPGRKMLLNIFQQNFSISKKFQRFLAKKIHFRQNFRKISAKFSDKFQQNFQKNSRKFQRNFDCILVIFQYVN